MPSIGSLVNLVIERASSLIFAPLTRFLKLIYYTLQEAITQTDDLDAADEDNSEMGNNKHIWFDGVDKRLIEAHSKKAEPKINGGEENLLTNKPLISYRGILKRRKRLLQLEQKRRVANGTKTGDNGTENGEAGPSSNGRKNGLATADKFDVSQHMIAPSSKITEELALDCEMVECYGHKSVLARISIVNLFGHVILDTFVAPPAQVSDYRTRYSGVRANDLKGAPSFETVQAQVANLIKDRIVVGHAVHNDFTVLKLHHPPDKIRDTSPYYGKHYALGKTPSLKRLCHSILGIQIQNGEHDSIQDAQATMKLYVKAREKWTESVLKSNKAGQQQQKQKTTKRQKTKPQKKKVKAFFVETL